MLWALFSKAAILQEAEMQTAVLQPKERVRRLQKWTSEVNSGSVGHKQCYWPPFSREAQSSCTTPKLLWKILELDTE